MKNKLVKISLLLIAILTVLCFAACGEIENPPAEKITIEFDEGDGSFADEEFEGSMEIDKGTAISEYPQVVNEGYVLKGWYFDEDFEDECDASHKFNENTTLYACWEVEVTYTVSFNTTRAGDGKTVEPQTVKAGGKVTAPGYEPTKKGLVFYGWCVDADKDKIWDFENDTVTEDIVIWAVFVRSSTDDGAGETCEHEYEITEYVAPTCETGGRIVQKCTKCKKTERLGKNDLPELAKLEHLEEKERVEPTCALDGYERTYCPNGCGLEMTITIRATGNHQYDDLGWVTAVQPTKYVDGRLENPCVVCGGAALSEPARYNAVSSDLNAPDISYLYTGGSYVNEPFVNVSQLGSILVSSCFDGTKGYYANDGDDNTFWNADTYADGVRYTDDWLELNLTQSYDIGALRFVLPNYVAWELGEGCYVSYDVEYWDESAAEWTYIGEVSDKNAVSIGVKCEVMIELESPINTNKIRVNVTHASRYAPAVIYEMETYAKAAATERLPIAIPSQATASVSGKYNEWVNGAGALVDNTTATCWTTDKRYNDSPWALLEFPVDKYIACVQISIGAVQNRAFLLEVYENGEWVELGTYSVPGTDENGDPILTGNVISNTNGICVFNIDIERTISKIRFNLTREPEYWTSYVYDITPYTIVERYDDEKEMPFTGCSHKNPRAGEVVAPTCNSVGYTVLNCSCGVTIKTKTTDMLAHDFGKYTIDTPATATALGTKVASCRNEGCTATSTISYEENYDAPVITPYLHDAPAAWAQTLDDGNYTDTYVWANKFYAKYGVRATVMMSITYTDGLISLWQDHFSLGIFDLGSHSYNHTSAYAGDANASTLLSEVVNAQYWFRHNYKGQYLLGFAAPLGTTSTGVAEYLTGPMAANRNGGDTGIFYNTLDQLTSRKVWGDLNSYISKSDQTEGIYVFVKNSTGGYLRTTVETPRFDENNEPVLDDNGNQIVDVTYVYEWTDSASEGTQLYYLNAKGEYVTAKASVNYVFDEDEMTFVDKGFSAGTYVYIEDEYLYEFHENGSYNLVDGEFVFVEDNGGEYKLVKTTVGSYEKGVEQLVALGGITVECLHSIGWGSIYSSYESTVSKLEHMTRLGVWGASYNDLIRYIKESQSANIEILERTDSSITLSVTDQLDDYMFNHAVTVKVDIPDSWQSVTVTQNGVEIPLVEMSFYSHTSNMQTVSCAIEEGYLYVDVIPDGGDVVITMGDKDETVSDYEQKVTVSFEPGEGELEGDEYEVRVVIGEGIASYPVPTRVGYKFVAWCLDEDCTEIIKEEVYTYTENTTLYALWEEIPQCTDGTYNHEWGDWLPSTSDDEESRVCKKCGATETQKVEADQDLDAPQGSASAQPAE